MQTKILIPSEDIIWAVQAAEESLGRWKTKRGHYNNRFNSHFKGKIGELAVEAFLMNQEMRNTPHFRSPESEVLCDIEIEARAMGTRCRIEVKTWSSIHWDKLGRCVSVYQFGRLRQKADRIVWAIVDELATLDPVQLRESGEIAVSLPGWNTL
ncbi:MAG: hypothetical protein ACC700_17045, partial [Anaerolineales bacterium]